MTKNRKRLNQTPWIPGNPLHSRPGYYSVRYVGRIAGNGDFNAYWDGYRWYIARTVSPSPDYFKGVQR